MSYNSDYIRYVNFRCSKVSRIDNIDLYTAHPSYLLETSMFQMIFFPKVLDSNMYKSWEFGSIEFVQWLMI